MYSPALNNSYSRSATASSQQANPTGSSNRQLYPPRPAAIDHPANFAARFHTAFRSKIEGQNIRRASIQEMDWARLFMERTEYERHKEEIAQEDRRRAAH